MGTFWEKSKFENFFPFDLSSQMGFHGQQFFKIHFCLPRGMNFDPLNCVKRLLQRYQDGGKYKLCSTFFGRWLYRKFWPTRKSRTKYIFPILVTLVAFSRNLVGQSSYLRVGKNGFWKTVGHENPFAGINRKKNLKIWFFPKKYTKTKIKRYILVLRYDWNELLHSFVRCFPCFGLLLPNDLVTCRRSPTRKTKVNVHWRSHEIRSINEERKNRKFLKFLPKFLDFRRQKKNRKKYISRYMNLDVP